MPVQLVADAEIGGAILDIIRKAQLEITMVSPYNRRWDEVAGELEKAHRRGVQVTVYYRDGTTDPGLYWATSTASRYSASRPRYAQMRETF